MSELKALYIPTRSGNTCHCYLKDDADTVIAELKQKLEDAKATAYAESVDAGMRELGLNRELCHQKYKRCLAMAKLCAKNVDHLNSEGYIYEKENRVNEVNDCIKGTNFYHKWHKRWLQIAEKCLFVRNEI